MSSGEKRSQKTQPYFPQPNVARPKTSRPPPGGGASDGAPDGARLPSIPTPGSVGRKRSSTAVSPPPFVEVELVYARVGELKGPWHAITVHTGNHVYACDPQMTCVAVTHAKTGQIESKHPMLGARLTGGQRGEGLEMEICYPLPRPGMEAVFERRAATGHARFTRTSVVERVVLRLQVSTVQKDGPAPNWASISGQFPGDSGNNT